MRNLRKGGTTAVGKTGSGDVPSRVQIVRLHTFRDINARRIILHVPSTHTVLPVVVLAAQRLPQ